MKVKIPVLVLVAALCTFWITAGLGSRCVGQERSAPTMDDLFGSIEEDEESEYVPSSSKLNLPENLTEVAIEIDESEQDELAAWVKWLVLKNLPPHYEDLRKWDQTKEIVSGLNVRWEDGKIKTNRRRKTVKHGTWQRHIIDFIDPQAKLAIVINKIDFSQPGQIGFAMKLEMPLALYSQLKQYQRGFQWYSISVKADATVSLEIDCTVKIYVNAAKLPPDVRFDPVVERASISLLRFEVHRISHIGGDAAEFMGNQLRGLLDKKLEEYDEKLAEKMNKQIAKQKDRLSLSLSDWMQKKSGQKSQQ
ncbi:MAG: hypothetical protein MUC43_12750 [Pirellula sp.]|jgi:hypothetical protein|nr:hypothetical protein [Pirellula sp.]